MTRVCRPAGAVALLLCVLATAPLGLSNAANREAMADAMVRMMEAMGFLDPGPGSGFPGGSSWAPAFGSFAMPGSIPGSAPYQDPSGRLDMGQAMRQFSRGMAGPGGGQSFPWMGSPLEGVWEGRGGELLIVQGNRFRIYAGTAAHVDGYVMVRTNRVALYNPVDSNTQLYEYAESQGRLALRDASGQLYLYRRLRLDAPAEANSARPSPPER